MDILNNSLLKNDKTLKNQVEQVVKQKMEYTLLGTYQLKKGMKLFSYDYNKNEVLEVKIKRGEYIVCELTTEGWIYYDPESFNVNIDTKLTYFQSPSITIANNLVWKFKEGKIKELFNLKKPVKTIDLFKHI